MVGRLSYIHLLLNYYTKEHVWGLSNTQYTFSTQLYGGRVSHRHLLYNYKVVWFPTDISYIIIRLSYIHLLLNYYTSLVQRACLGTFQYTIHFPYAIIRW